eukprot:6191259-Pleurochrysis_carterae.AAC.3
MTLSPCSKTCTQHSLTRNQRAGGAGSRKRNEPNAKKERWSARWRRARERVIARARESEVKMSMDYVARCPEGHADVSKAKASTNARMSSTEIRDMRCPEEHGSEHQVGERKSGRAGSRQEQD